MNQMAASDRLRRLQPDGGLVLAKSFYRTLGTIAGVLVSISLVFTFPQPGELFLRVCPKSFSWIAELSEHQAD